MTELGKAAPQYSADGNWWWNGTEWMRIGDFVIGWVPIAINAKDHLLAASMVATGRTLWTIPEGRRIADEIMWAMLIEAQTNLVRMQPAEICTIMIPEMFYGLCEAAMRILYAEGEGGPYPGDEDDLRNYWQSTASQRAVEYRNARIEARKGVSDYDQAELQAEAKGFLPLMVGRMKEAAGVDTPAVDDAAWMIAMTVVTEVGRQILGLCDVQIDLESPE